MNNKGFSSFKSTIFHSVLGYISPFARIIKYYLIHNSYLSLSYFSKYHMKLSFTTLLLLFCCICLAMSHPENKIVCEHNKQQEQNPAGFLDIEEDFSSLESGRVLATANYSQIRMIANYDSLNASAPASYTAYVRDLLAPAVLSYFQGALKVKYPVAGNLTLGNSVSTLCNIPTPSILQTGVAADYVILFSSRSEDTNILATSTYCYLASGSKRPLVANTDFNRAVFKEANGDVILHEKNTYLLIHEMMHTLGFSSSLFKYFLDANGKTLSGHVTTVTIQNNTHTVVNIPALTDKLRTFHGCSTLPGAIMENDGGSGTDGSHFEKKFYLYEVMETSAISGKRVSELSLGLLEGSGWYVVDYTYAEPYFYGQGEGCDFINGQCSNTTASFEEFCVGSGRGCTSQGHAGGSCYSDTETQGCKYILADLDIHCENPGGANYARLSSVEVYGRGLGSKCFTGTLSTKTSASTTSYCFQYTCAGQGIGAKLQVQLGKTSAVCTQAGPLAVAGYKGTIDCPDPLTFCNTVGKLYCPRNCLGRGQCVNNQCQCNPGFTGVDCALSA